VTTLRDLAKKTSRQVAQSNAVMQQCTAFLAERQAFGPRVQQQFELGIEYWALESQLCSDTVELEPAERLAKAKRASSLKSFDYRSLHLVLYALTGRAVDDSTTAYLSTCFHLVEVEDDLKDYAKVGAAGGGVAGWGGLAGGAVQ
jgi:hypothetical protein